MEVGNLREPGRNIGRSEMVASELNGLITRRHDARVAEEGERPAEEAWMESERAHNARLREENRLAWCQYHREQAARLRRTLEPLIRKHEEAAARIEATDERITA